MLAAPKLTPIILAVMIALPAWAANDDGDLFAEKVMDTADGAVWAMRWSYGEYGGPWGQTKILTSDEAALGYLEKHSKERCRVEGHQSYFFATFADVEAEPRLRSAWEHFGGDQQSGGIRKTSFRLVVFGSEIVPDGRISSKVRWRSCWTDRQRKEEARRQREHEKRLRWAKKKAGKSGGG